MRDRGQGWRLPHRLNQPRIQPLRNRAGFETIHITPSYSPDRSVDLDHLLRRNERTHAGDVLRHLHLEGALHTPPGEALATDADENDTQLKRRLEFAWARRPGGSPASCWGRT